MWAGPRDRLRRRPRSSGPPSGRRALRATAVHHGYLAEPREPEARDARTLPSRVPATRSSGRSSWAWTRSIFHPGAHLEARRPRGCGPWREPPLGSRGGARREGPARSSRTPRARERPSASTFEELAEVLRAVGAPTRLGVLLDTLPPVRGRVRLPHRGGLRRAMSPEWTARLGPDAVRAFHLNDAKAPVGSHLDRHENIGTGRDRCRWVPAPRERPPMGQRPRLPRDAARRAGVRPLRRGPCDAPRAGRPRRKTRCAASRRPVRPLGAPQRSNSPALPPRDTRDGGRAGGSIASLEATAREIRRDVIRMTYIAGSGHPGGSLSVTDLMTALVFHEMNSTLAQPDLAERDRLVLSKGHAAPALYAALPTAGSSRGGAAHPPPSRKPPAGSRRPHTSYR